MSGEMQRLLARLRRTETLFPEWKEDQEKGGKSVADTCELSKALAEKVFRDTVTVIVYFLNNMLEFEGTISDLVVAGVRVKKTRVLNHFAATAFMAARDHFETTHQTMQSMGRREPEHWARAAAALKRLTKLAMDGLRVEGV
jgi:hypothetical protein